MGVNALIYAVIVLVVFGLVWWLVETYILPKVADRLTLSFVWCW